MSQLDLQLPADLARLFRDEPALSRAYLVGGCVRDALLHRPLKDFDVEVFGIGFEALSDALGSYGRVDLVGRSFGVAKLVLGGAVHDFALPRQDSKVGPGHRGFEVRFDPDITPREAAARRDFTINALMWDPRTRAVLDFFAGEDDLRRRILRPTSAAFSEDPLRVLRGMQFAARYELTPAPETVEACRQIVASFPQLAGERVRDEWFKWASGSSTPSIGLRFLEATGWMAHFPEIACLRDVPQDPEWHPEGDVFSHTCHCLDALVRLPEWIAAEETTRIVWSLAVLTHDLGKAVSTRRVVRDGLSRIVSPGHERESARLAGEFLGRIHAPQIIVDRVLPLVENHMAHYEEVTDRAVRRLARRLHPETVERLCVLMTADAFGRPPRPAVIPKSVGALRATAQQLELSHAAPRAVILGRHLLAMGLNPGPEVGRWIGAAFEAQLDGQFRDVRGGLQWLADQGGLPEAARHQARLLADRDTEG